jgi:hypothetical protein
MPDIDYVRTQVEYSASEESVSIPGSIAISVLVKQGDTEHTVHTRTQLISREASDVLYKRRLRTRSNSLLPAHSERTASNQGGGEGVARGERRRASWFDGVYVVSIRREEAEFERLQHLLRAIGTGSHFTLALLVRKNTNTDAARAVWGRLGGGGGGALEAERWEAFDASEPIAHHFALLEVLHVDLKSPTTNASKEGL